MPFPQISLKIKIAAILGWLGRSDSKLKVTLLYERAFDKWYFGQYMYFAVAIIKLSGTKFPEKNCKFQMLYLEKYTCDESVFLGDNKPEAIFLSPWKLSISTF